MAKSFKKEKKPLTPSKVEDFVTVTHARDSERAKEYESLLKNNDIPVAIKEYVEQPDESMKIAVMVPEEYLDEAHVIVESQDVYDDFYDLVLEDDESDDYDDDFPDGEL